jgi:hypothetical protein
LGYASLYKNRTGDDNVAVGNNAGYNIDSGMYNIYIGQNASGSSDSVSHEILIGAGGTNQWTWIEGGGTETVRIGTKTDYITNDFGENATWTHSSDRRIKKDIKDNTLGLNFINKLKTRNFKKKAPSEYPPEFSQHNPNATERKNPDKKRYGFIAQEVKEAMDKVGHPDFTVWSEGRDGMQELGEVEFITPLIKAVQELSSDNKRLENKINDLEIFIMDKLGDE